MKEINQISRFLVIVFVFATLIGCGGGGESNSNDSPQESINSVPTITNFGTILIEKSGFIKHTAEVKDQDGLIDSYSWNQTQGNDVPFEFSDNLLSFSTLDIHSNQIISFELTVTDNGGATSSSTFNFDVKLPEVIMLPAFSEEGQTANIALFPGQAMHMQVEVTLLDELNEIIELSPEASISMEVDSGFILLKTSTNTLTGDYSFSRQIGGKMVTVNFSVNELELDGPPTEYIAQLESDIELLLPQIENKLTDEQYASAVSELEAFYLYFDDLPETEQTEIALQFNGVLVQLTELEVEQNSIIATNLGDKFSKELSKMENEPLISNECKRALRNLLFANKRVAILAGATGVLLIYFPPAAIATGLLALAYAPDAEFNEVVNQCIATPTRPLVTEIEDKAEAVSRAKRIMLNSSTQTSSVTLTVEDEEIVSFTYQVTLEQPQLVIDQANSLILLLERLPRTDTLIEKVKAYIKPRLKDVSSEIELEDAINEIGECYGKPDHFICHFFQADPNKPIDVIDTTYTIKVNHPKYDLPAINVTLKKGREPSATEQTYFLQLDSKPLMTSEDIYSATNGVFKITPRDKEIEDSNFLGYEILTEPTWGEFVINTNSPLEINFIPGPLTSVPDSLEFQIVYWNKYGRTAPIDYKLVFEVADICSEPYFTNHHDIDFYWTLSCTSTNGLDYEEKLFVDYQFKNGFRKRTEYVDDEGSVFIIMTTFNSDFLDFPDFTRQFVIQKNTLPQI